MSIAVAVAIGMWAVGAQAYCRTTTCDPNKEDCAPAAGEECTTQGKALYWPGVCVSYNLQKDASPGITFDEFATVAAASFGAWTSVDCGGGVKPSISVEALAPISQAYTCYNQTSGNSNAVFFQSDRWPYADTGSTLALTTVTFNTETGEIYDVDMEINSASKSIKITVGDADVQYDLQAILTHEAGHFYGLAHHPVKAGEPVCPATMCPTYKAGTTALRTLKNDDIAGMCAIYPVDRVIGGPCDATPRHGFGTTCDAPQPAKSSGCCSNATAPGQTSAHGLGALVALMLGVMLQRVRRRAR
jgi:hypothetical protein